MRNMPKPKQERLERQQAKRKVKEERRLERRAKLTPLEAEIGRCDAIAGHPTTRAERDAIRQTEVRELVNYIAAGWAEADRIATERRGAARLHKHAPECGK